jgi:Fic family protein
MNGMIEAPSRIEPCLPEYLPLQVTDLVASLSAAAANLGSRLHPHTRANLADLVRIMNCYYSNLIEGHDTHPRDIERALAGRLAEEKERRNLQLEAAAHIRVQRAVDAMAAAGELPNPASGEFIRWLHAEFYRDAPAELLRIRNQSGTVSFDMVPGEYRSLPVHEVTVGRHQPPSSERVEAFMRHFSWRYQFQGKGKGTRIIAMAAAHHRLNYIHPFPDGNGRVSRLMSHAMAHAADIGAGGLWSVSRGLARGIESRGEYKLQMDAADTPRQGSLDGRGNLSLKALLGFIEWFLRVCFDQVTFMGSLFDLTTLGTRLRGYVEMRETFRPQAVRLLEEILLRGEMARGDAGRVSGLSERTARTLVGVLVEDGIVGSDTPKGPLSLRFPLHAVEVLFPRLFPAA